MLSPKIERVTKPVILGEAPHWDSDTQTLYYIDIINAKIHQFHPSTKTSASASVGLNQVSFIIPIEGVANQFVVSLGRELIRIYWDGSAETRVIEKIAEVEKGEEYLYNRFNDGKCDPTGRLWTGTLNTVAESPLVYPPKGTLYSLDASRKIKGHVSQLRISNGIAFNEQLKKMYFIDSLKKGIDQYDIDFKTGTISNLETIFTLEAHQITGIPDGMTIDTEGNLWVAIFNGGQVIKIDPKTPESLLQTIQMPVQQVTSLAFGGPNLDELYVTTGAFKINPDDHFPPPDNGAIFKITNLGTHGSIPSKMRLDNI